jgi:hypothetical protein
MSIPLRLLLLTLVAWLSQCLLAANLEEHPLYHVRQAMAISSGMLNMFIPAYGTFMSGKTVLAGPMNNTLCIENALPVKNPTWNLLRRTHGSVFLVGGKEYMGYYDHEQSCYAAVPGWDRQEFDPRLTVSSTGPLSSCLTYSTVERCGAINPLLTDYGVLHPTLHASLAAFSNSTAHEIELLRMTADVEILLVKNREILSNSSYPYRDAALSQIMQRELVILDAAVNQSVLLFSSLADVWLPSLAGLHNLDDVLQMAQILSTEARAKFISELLVVRDTLASIPNLLITALRKGSISSMDDITMVRHYFTDSQATLQQLSACFVRMLHDVNHDGSDDAYDALFTATDVFFHVHAAAFFATAHSLVTDGLLSEYAAVILDCDRSSLMNMSPSCTTEDIVLPSSQRRHQVRLQSLLDGSHAALKLAQNAMSNVTSSPCLLQTFSEYVDLGFYLATNKSFVPDAYYVLESSARWSASSIASCRTQFAYVQSLAVHATTANCSASTVEYFCHVAGSARGLLKSCSSQVEVGPLGWAFRPVESTPPMTASVKSVSVGHVNVRGLTGEGVEGSECSLDYGSYDPFYLCGCGLYCFNDVCTRAGLGFFSLSDSNQRLACENVLPLHSHFTDASSCSAECNWECDIGYMKSGASCDDTPLGFYLHDGVVTVCPVPLDEPFPYWVWSTGRTGDYPCLREQRYQAVLSVDGSALDVVSRLSGNVSISVGAYLYPSSPVRKYTLMGMDNRWELSLTKTTDASGFFEFRCSSLHGDSTILSDFVEIRDRFIITVSWENMVLFLHVDGHLISLPTAIDHCMSSFSEEGIWYVGGIATSSGSPFVGHIFAVWAHFGPSSTRYSRFDGRMHPLWFSSCGNNCSFKLPSVMTTEHYDEIGTIVLPPCKDFLFRRDDMRCDARELSFVSLSANTVVLSTPQWGQFEDNFYPGSSGRLALRKVVFYGADGARVYPSSCSVSGPLRIGAVCSSIYAGNELRDDWQLSFPDFYVWISFSFGEEDIHIARIVIFNSLNSSSAVKQIVLMSSIEYGASVSPGLVLSPTFYLSTQVGNYVWDARSILPELMRQTQVVGRPCPSSFSVVSDSIRIRTQETCSCVAPLYKFRGGCRTLPHVQVDPDVADVDFDQFVTVRVLGGVVDAFHDNVAVFYRLNNSSLLSYISPFVIGTIGMVNITVIVQQSGVPISSVSRMYKVYGRSALIMQTMPGTYVDELLLSYTCSNVPGSVAASYLYYQLNDSSSSSSFALYDGRPFYVTDGPQSFTLSAFCSGLFHRSSDVFSGQYVIQPRVKPVSWSSSVDTFVRFINVSFMSATPAVIFSYSLNSGPWTRLQTATLFLDCTMSAQDMGFTLRARAEKVGYLPSSIFTRGMLLLCPPSAPYFTPAAGTYALAVPISISMNYSNTGQDTSLWLSIALEGQVLQEFEYQTPLVFDSPLDVNLTAWNRRTTSVASIDSERKYATFKFRPVSAIPGVFPISGDFVGCTVVSLSGNGLIFFSVGVTELYSLYESPLKICFNSSTAPHTTIVPISFYGLEHNKLPSSVGTSVFRLFPQCAPPVFNTSSGEYYKTVSVNVICSDIYSTVHFTDNDSNPTSNSSVWRPGGQRFNRSVVLRVACVKESYFMSEIVALNLSIVTSRFPLPPSVALESDVIHTNSLVRLICSAPSCVSHYSFMRNGFVVDGPRIYGVPFTLPVGNVTLRYFTSAPDYDGPSVDVLSSFTVLPFVSVADFTILPVNGTQFWPELNITLSSTLPFWDISASIFSEDYGIVAVKSRSFITINSSSVVTLRVNTTGSYPSLLDLPSYRFFLNESMRPAHCEMPASNDSRAVFSFYGAVSFSALDPNCSVWLSVDGVNYLPRRAFSYACSDHVDYVGTLYVKTHTEHLDWSDVLVQPFVVICPPGSVSVMPLDQVSPSPFTMTASFAQNDPFSTVIYSVVTATLPIQEAVRYVSPVVFSLYGEYEVSIVAVKRKFGVSLTSQPTIRKYVIQPTAAPVVFSLLSGTFYGDIGLTLSSSQGSSGIRFSIDSSSYNIPYVGQLTLRFNSTLAPSPTNLTVFAKNYVDGHFPSAGTVQLFTIFPKAGAPVVSVSGGTFYRNFSLAVHCPRTETHAFYTLDGSLPGLSNLLASTGNIFIYATVQTVRVACMGSGWVSSDVVSVGPFFIVHYRMPTRPVISHVSSNHALPNKSISVSISCVEVGCRSYYTVDGTTPTLASHLYTSPITFSSVGPVVVRSVVHVHGYDSLSVVSTDTFTVYREFTVDDVMFSHLSGYRFWPSFHLSMFSRNALEIFYRVITDGLASPERPYSSPVLIDSNATIFVVVQHPYLTPSPYALPPLSFVLDESLTPAIVNVPVANVTSSHFVDIVIVKFSPVDAQVQVGVGDGSWRNLTDNIFSTSCTDLNFTDLSFNQSLRAIREGFNPSPVSFFTFQLLCTPTAPVASISDGIFESPVVVEILSTTRLDDTQVHYTLDGTEPNSQSLMYTEPITIPGLGTVSISAIAVRRLLADLVLSSKISRRMVTIKERSLMPFVYPRAGRFVRSVTVAITSPTVSATVWCSMNGNQTFELYRQPLVFTCDRSVCPSVTSVVLTCVAREDNKLPSWNVTQLYSIVPQSSPPVIVPLSGSYYKKLLVHPVCDADESAIPLCTSDGNDPGLSSLPVNSTGILVTVTTVLQCRCYADGWVLSDALVRHYTVISSRFPDPVAFSHPSLQFSAPFNLSLSCATAASRIFYTTDRSAVAPFVDHEYFTPIRLSDSNVNVCAVCWAADHDGTSSTVCHSYRYVFPISMSDILLSYPDGHRFWPALNVTMVNPKSLNVRYRLVVDNGTILTNWAFWTSNVIVSSSCTIEMLLSAPYSLPTVVSASVHYVFDPSLRAPHADAPSFGSTQLVAVGNFSIPITTNTRDGLVEVFDDTTDAFHPLYSGVYRRACTSYDDIFFTLKARAYTLNLARSDEVSVDVTLICPPPPPVIYPPSTDVGELLVVTMFQIPSSTVVNRYTLDGTDVTPSSPAYSGYSPLVFPYVAGSSVIVKARSYKSTLGHLVASEEVRSGYSFLARASPPTVTPPAVGSFVGSVTVSMATVEPVDFVSFRVNGGNWTIYDHPLVLHFDPLLAPGSTLFNVYCKAARSLHSDSVVVISSFIVLPQLDPPTVLPESGLYAASVNYSVNCPVGATARYANDPAKAVSQWLSIDPGTLRTLTPEHSGRWTAICQKSGWVDSDQTVRDLIIVSSKFTTAPHIVFSSASVDAGVYIGPLSVTLLCFDPRCEIVTTLTMSTTTRTFTATNNTVVFIEQYGPVAITAIANASDSAPSTKVSLSFLIKKVLDASIVMLTPSKNETFVGTLLVTIDQRDMSGPGIEASYQLNYLNGSSSSLSVPLGSVVGIQESLDLLVTISGMHYYPQYHSLGPFRYTAIVSNGTRLDDSGSGQGNVSSSSVQSPSTSSSSDDAATTSGVTAGIVALFTMVAVSISGFVAMKWWRKRKNVQRRENIDKMHLLSSAT